MISLRLSDDLENKLEMISKSEKISKSEVVKRALVKYMDDYRRRLSPYDLGSDLFGRYGSGDGNLSRDYRKILKAKLREKHSR